MQKIVIGIIIVGVILTGGFFVFNSYVYNEKQENGEIVLESNGLGVVNFGSPSEETIVTLSTILGDPSKDTGLIEGYTYGACPSEKIRVVEWGRLRVYFGDTHFGTDSMFLYEYTARDTESLLPTLYTNKNVTLEMSKSQLLKAHPGTQVYPWLEEYEWMHIIPYNKETREYLGGSLENDRVFWITGGLQCGE